MSDLPWERFARLSGAPQHNFELLCRELVRRRYERFGPLRTRKNQPGVEFHLKVEREGSSLGEPGRHWGWQCRWYGPNAFRQNGRLKAAQRRGIEDAIEKSGRHVEDLTDWVLWTRDKLGADDSRWFEELGAEAPFTLRHYDEETLLGLLTGDAEILRETWFGDLVLDRGRLEGARVGALAPIRRRYEEELHVRTPSESEILALLPCGRLRDEVDRLREMTARALSAIRAAPKAGVAPDVARELSRLLRRSRETLERLHGVLDAGELPSAAQVDEVRGELEPGDDVRDLLNRTANPGDSTVSLVNRAVNATLGWLDDLHYSLETPMVAAVGAAGAGKTHLAADLTKPAGDAGGGVLVLGRQFGVAIDDDHLAVKTGLASRRDDLLESMEAMGAREGRRVPLVIDGLNEAKAPPEWKVALARLQARLQSLPHVLAIVTVRPSYTERCLPDETPQIEVAGFEGVEEEAVGRYFDYYKIDADPEQIHWWRSSDPLLLSLFCRAVNPDGRERVDTDQLPGSLHEVFDLHMEGIVERVADNMEVDRKPVEDAIDRLAMRFFAEGERALTLDVAAEILGDDPWAQWDKSLRFNLEAEGLLLRDQTGEGETILWSYDLLGGDLIAQAILADRPDRAQLAAEELTTAVERHPLREDIVAGLSGRLAAEGADLVEILGADTELWMNAALASARLSATEVGAAAQGAIEAVFEARPRETLDALAPLALRLGHPLNAQVLDRLLADLSPWDRDLRWTEWLRSRSETIEVALTELGRGIRNGDSGCEVPDALAWLTWILTTTDKRLRDHATYVLYELGRHDPDALFDRALSMLGANDPWVAEGLLAASYGVAMAAQDPACAYVDEVERLAAALRDRILDGRQPTSNWLIREYAFRVCQLARWLSGEAPSTLAQPPMPQPAGAVPPFEPDSKGWDSVSRAFGMDFSNYTIGRLFRDRANYDDSHRRFLEVTGEIRARVADLGWTEERFLEVDREIGSANFRRDNDPHKVERYGKKYSWIAYFEAAGRISDAGALVDAVEDGHRLSDVPVDPSFPRDAEPLPLELEPWATEEGSDEEWARGGRIEVPDGLLRNEFFGEGRGWVALDGYVRHDPADSKRKVFCFVRGILALEGWTSVEEFVAEHGVSNDTVPRLATDYYCFAGEVPWSPTFDHFATGADGTPAPHLVRLGRLEDGPEAELLAVEFCWESYHSALNDARIGAFPAKHLAATLGLRKLPEKPALVDSNGELAAVDLMVAQHGWSGHLTYLRGDLLRAYQNGRGGDWGWIVWGEREFFAGDWGREDVPAWLRDVRLGGADRFSRVIALAD